MAGFPNPCVIKPKLTRPGYGLEGSFALMLLGVPTVFTMAWSSFRISLKQKKLMKCRTMHRYIIEITMLTVCCKAKKKLGLQIADNSWDVLCCFDHSDPMLSLRSACVLTCNHLGQLHTREVVVTEAMIVFSQVNSLSYTEWSTKKHYIKSPLSTFK